MLISNLGIAISNIYSAVVQHAWMGLVDENQNLLCSSTDRGIDTFANFEIHTFPMVRGASGAISGFTTTYSGIHYIAVNFTVSVGPIRFLSTNNNTPVLFGPQLSFYSTTTVGNPPTFPTTLANNGTFPMVYCTYS
jgi:hypothetical protein